MPCYFFHFVRGEARIPDPDGIIPTAMTADSCGIPNGALT